MTDAVFAAALSVAVAAGAAAAAGCHKTLKSRVAQPNPLCQPTETLRDSRPAVIVTGDMDLRAPVYHDGVGEQVVQRTERIPLRNVAAFSVVSRDRLRFHIQVEHKWREWADPTRWHVYLIDDRGNRWEPDDIFLVENEHVVSMWDYEARTAVRDAHGDIRGIRQDGYKDRRPLGSLSMFRGRASVAFYDRDLFHTGLGSLTLVMERKNRTMKFTWEFSDSGNVRLAGDGPCGPHESVAERE